MSSPHNVPDGAGVGVPANPPRDRLIRAVFDPPTYRDDQPADGTIGVLRGHFARFNEWTEINSMFEGHFRERIAPGAFSKTFRENGDRIKVLYDHGHDPSIGNKILGIPTMLREDDEGGYYEVPLFDTSYNRDLEPGLKAGAYGASFRFQVVREDYNKRPARSEENPDGLPERTITEAKVAEFGPVSFPAYAGATAGMRSMTDRFIFESLTQDPDKLRELIEGRKQSHSRAFITSAPAAKVTFTINGVTYNEDTQQPEPTGARADVEAVHQLACAADYLQAFIADETEEGDQEDIAKANQALVLVQQLIASEATEPADDSADGGTMFYSAEPTGEARQEPEPSEATTPKGATTDDAARTGTSTTSATPRYTLGKGKEKPKWHLS